MVCVQVLQMSVPVDEDSVADFQLDFSSDKSHHLNLDSISYITRDGNSSTGQSGRPGRSQTPSPSKRTSSSKTIKIEQQYTRTTHHRRHARFLAYYRVEE